MTNSTPENGPNAEIVERGPQFDDVDLLAIETFDDALRLTADELGGIANVGDELGNGFAILDKKDSLIGVPCVFMSWNFNEGDFGPFVSAQVAARSESGGVRKLIVNDGSTGIYAQLSAYTKRTGKMGGLMARAGLTRSDYEYTDSEGKTRPASTFYIDTSA